MSRGIEKGKRDSAGKGAEAGDILSVLYDPNYQRRNAVYPLALVRVGHA